MIRDRLSEAAATEVEAREQLLTLQGEIEKATEKVALIPQYERSLAITRQQLSALEKANATEVIALQRQIAEEKEIRTRIGNQVEALKVEIANGSPGATAVNLRALAEPTKLIVGGAEFTSILNGCDAFVKETSKAHAEVRTSFERFEKAVGGHLATWRAREAEALKLIETKRKELEAQNIRLDMSYIQKLAKDEASHNQSIINLKTWIPHLKEVKARRGAALKARWAAREKVSGIRDAYARRATRTLEAALSDLKVSLKFVANGHSPDGERLIIETMGWKTNQMKRAAILVEQLTIPVLLQAIDRKDSNAITELKTPENTQQFNKA